MWKSVRSRYSPPHLHQGRFLQPYSAPSHSDTSQILPRLPTNLNVAGVPCKDAYAIAYSRPARAHVCVSVALMDGKRETYLLFAAAAALRLGLFVFFPGLADLLVGRVEVSTPITSFKRCMCTHSSARLLDRSLVQHRVVADLVRKYRKAFICSTRASLPTMAASSTK